MSPRTKQQFEELRASSTAKILSASLELFGTIGFQATSISRIAEKAGVSKGLIYNYFDSKEALLKAMIEELTKEGDKVITVSKADDPAVMLESMIRGAIGWLRDHEKQNRLVLSLITQVDQFDFVREMANAKINEFLVILSDLLQKINYPNHRSEARILVTLFDGIGMQYLVLKQDYPLDEIEDMLVERYCRPKKYKNESG